MRSRWNLPIYVVFVALSALVVGFIVAGMGIALPGSHRYAVTATFSDAADILENNEVYMNGSKIGYVGAVSVERGLAKVQLVIDNPKGLPLYTDASAEVRKKNLLGETYVDLQRGDSRQNMPDGGSIPVDHTIPITEIDQVLAIFDPITVQRVQLLINAAGGALTNNGPTMNSEAVSLNDVLTTLNNPAIELSVRKGQVQSIVLELQRFYTVLANQRDQVKQEFGTWNQVMSQLANQEAGIAGTLQQADTLLQSFDTLFSGQTGNIRTIVEQLAASGGVLDTTNSFLDTSNHIIAALAPYRQYISDVFPDLQTSFADTDPSNNQNFWSVFSVNCEPNQCSSGAAPSSQQTPSSSSSVWASYSGGGGR